MASKRHIGIPGGSFQTIQPVLSHFERLSPSSIFGGKMRLEITDLEQWSSSLAAHSTKPAFKNTMLCPLQVD